MRKLYHCVSILILFFALSLSAQSQNLTVVSGSPQNPDVVNSFALTLSDPTNFNQDCYNDGYGNYNCYNSYTITIAQGGYNYYSGSAGAVGSTTISSTMSELQSVPNNSVFNVTVTDSHPQGEYGIVAGPWSCTNCFRTSNLAVTTSGVDVSCNTLGSATANVTGGLAPFTYSWTGGGSTQTIAVTTPGTYTVSVTDANSITVNSSVTIGGVANLAITATGSDIDDLCVGGTVSVVVNSGTPPYSYAWSEGSTSSSVSGLAPGVYSVDVTDGNGCVKSASTTVAYIPTLAVESGSPQEASVNSFSLELSDPTGSTFDVASNGYHVQNDYDIEITDCGGTIYFSDDILPNTIPVPWNGMLNATMDLVNTPPGNVMLDVRVRDNVGGGDWVCSGCFQTVATPDNDLCADAESLVCGVPTTGSTVGATATDSPTNCNAFASDLGVWYTFIGTGLDVKLSTCGSSTTATTPATPWFAVYSGDCANLTCIGSVSSPDADCSAPNSNSAAYEFTSVAGVVYYVFVTANSGAPATVDFDLTLTCSTPDNNLCIEAEPLSCGVPTTGSTLGATDAGSPTGCSTLSGDRPVWYTFTGTGGNVEVSTCGPITDASNATFLAVFSGQDCNQLTCVEDMFSSPGTTTCGTAGSASVGFTSVIGETYYVYVASLAGGATDIDFDLTLTCDPTVGITEYGIEELNIYPNPSNGQFVMELKGVDADAQITVLDITGRQVYAETVVMNGSFRKEFNLDATKGAYLLQFSTAKGRITRKIQIH